MAPKAFVAPVSDVPPAPKYDDVLSMLRAERKSQVQGAMFAAQDAVPERRARAIELAKRFHTQPEFVERHYEEFEKAAKPALDYDELVDKFPGLSKWLTEPDNAALGKNELHALSKAEASLRKLMPPKPEPFAFDQALKTGWNQFTSGMWALGAAYGQGDPDAMAERYFESSQRAKRLAETAPQYAQEWKRVVLEQEGQDLQAAFNRLATTFESIRRERILEGLKALGQDASMTVAEFFDMVLEAAKRPAGTLYFNLEQLPQMAPSLGLSAAGALGGFAVAGPPGAYVGYLGGNFIGQVPVETGAWIAEELKNHGVNTDDLESVKAAFRNPQLMARLRSEGLAKGITTAAVDTMFAALGGKLVAQAGSLPRKLVRGAVSVAAEAAGEGVSEAAGQLAARGGDITKVDPVEVAAEIIGGLGHSVGQTAIGAAAASVRKSLPRDTVDAAEELVSRVSKANQAIEAAGHLQQVVTAIREAKTVAAIPEKVQELVDAVADGEATEVFFQTDDWDAYWTGKGLSPAKAAEDIMGDGAKAYMEAKTSGAPMAIPMGAYVAKVAPTEHFEGLLPFTRTAIDGMTFQQAREELRALPATMEELVREATTAPVSERTPPTGGVVTEEIDRKAKALQKRIAAELKAAGRSAQEAKHAAALVAGGYRAMAARLGDKGQAILDRFNFRIRGGDQAAKAQGVPTGSYDLNQPSVEALPQKVAWEAIPSPDIAAEIAAASPAVRAEFTEKALDLLRENGQDALATQLGIESPQVERQSGGFGGRINSNVITSFPASTPVEKVAAYARAVQYLFRQKAVPYFTAKAPGSPGTVEGVAFEFANTLEGAQEEAFFQALREVFGPDVGYTKTDAREAVVINFGKDPKFNEKLNLFREKYDERITIKTAYKFGADGDYGPVHDWSSDPEGEALRPRADAPGSSSLVAWLDSRRALFDKLLEQYSGESLRAREDAVRADARGGGGRGAYWQEANRGTLQAENEARIAELPASSPGPNPLIRKAAQDYLAKAGIPERRQSRYVKADPERGKRIADAYEAMRHAPNDPEVQAAYRAFIDETLAQYQVIKELGLVIEMIQPGQPNPYPEGPRQVLEDIRNGHLWVFPTEQGFGSLSTETNHPLLEKTGEKIGDYELVANDVFRIVHDVFGHAKEGFGFGPNGEENAWQAHVRMYSPLAAKAMTTETRGQNSWVNFGPYGEANRANQKATIYADQKAGLLPEWVETEGLAPDIEQSFYQTSLPAISDLSPIGFFSQLAREVEKMDFKTIPAKDLAGRIKNLPGIKAEELEWTGFLDFLKAKEVSGEKVTKEEAMAFLKENGVHVEQVVLAQEFRSYDPDFPPRPRPTPDELSWDDGKVVPPDPETIWENAHEDIFDVVNIRVESGSDHYYYESIYRLTGKKFEEALEKIKDNEYGKAIVKKVEELRKEYGPEFTRGDGEIDVEARDAKVRRELRFYIKTEIYNKAYKAAYQRYIEDEYSDWKYKEAKTGYSLIGSEASGSWHSPEMHRTYTGSLEEAKRQLLEDMLRAGVVVASREDTQTDEDVDLGPNKPKGHSKWGQHTVLGPKKNYREILLTLPRVAGEFKKDVHFRGQKNFFAHARVSDRIDLNGKRTLFIEELQSDWHQQGREYGYQDKETRSRIEALTQEINALTKERDALLDRWADLVQSGAHEEAESTDRARRALNDRIAELIQQQRAEEMRVPDAPFKQTEAWATLAMKRMLRLAVEQRYDAVAWTPGSVHVERYGTDSIGWQKLKTEYAVYRRFNGRDSIAGRFATQEKASDFIRSKPVGDEGEYRIEEVPTETPAFLVGAVEQQGGNAGGIDIEALARQRGLLLERYGVRVTTKKELENVIASVLGRQRGDRSRENLTEQVWKEMQEKETGARFPRKEGMEFFYDNVLPRKVVPAILKKLDKDAKVTTTRIRTQFYTGNYGDTDQLDTGEQDDPLALVAWSVPITDKMREEIRKGFSLFQRDDNSPLGRIHFGPDGINIDLLKKANPSTFIHELGHFYLELLKEAALMEDAPADIREDYQKVLAWLGVSDSSQITREHHEKWARGFEKYLAEGNAPSSALREAFEKFKIWLIAVYKELTRLNVTLTPEVRGVMDRLVATREEIAAVQKEVATPLFENPSQYGFTPEKAARYQRLKDEAIRKAEEALLKTHMAELEERQTAEYEAERERIRFEVEAHVNAMPVYKAWAGIRRGETPDGTPLPGGATRLSTEGVKEIYGFRVIPGNIRALALTSKDGMHPDVVAELYGFRSGREMVDAIAQAVPKEELIDRLTDERMRLERPELIHDPKRLRQEALAAVHNSPRGELLRLELEHLASEDMPLLKEGIRRIAKRVPSNKAVRQQAERIIGATKIRDLRPAGFLFAERRMAKEAGEKLAKGDLDGAFEAKRKELLNHELYRAATAAQASVLKAKKDFKRFFRKDEELAKTREMNLINTARAILARFNIGPRPEKSVASYLDMLREYDKDAHAAMMALYESAVRSTGDLNDVTYDDFEAMKSAVDAMWSLARNMRMVEINGKRMALEEAKSELKARLSELPPMVKPGEARPGLDRAVNDKDRLILGLMGLRARLRRVESWADSMDGGRFRDNPVFRKILVQGVIDALGRYRDAKRAAIEKYLGLVQSIEASLKGTSRTKILAPELGRIRPFEFRNKAHLLGVMLHTGNLSNKSKLVAGMGWGERDAEGNVDFRAFDAFVKRMEDEGVLTKADYDFLQSVWDFFEEYKPEAQRVFKELYGHYFSEITADAIETRFGTYRGGYVPAIPDPEVVSDASVRQDKEALEKVGNSFAFPTTGRGFTKKRVESYAVPLVADLAKLPMLIDKQLRFIHVEPAVKQVARIIMAPDFREALAQVDPTVTEELLVPWLQRAAQQVVEMPIQGKGGRLFAKFMRELRSRSGMQIMFANITNALQQPTGLAIAAAKVGPLGKRARLRFLRNALWTYITAPKKTAAEIVAMSAAMRNRLDSEAAAMHSTMEELLLDPTKFERAREFAKKHAYFMQSAMQNVVDIIVWQATYNEHLEAGFTNDEAVKAADADVRLTQGSLAPEDVSSIEANNAFVRAFTQFTSYFNMQANFLGTEFGNVLREVGLKKGYADMAWIYFFGFAAVSVASGFIVEAMSGKIDKDDDDEYLDDLLALLVNSQVRTAVAFVPGVGAATTAAYDALTTGRREDRVSLSPSISAVESGIGALRAGRSLFTGDSINEKKAVRDVLTTLGLISGLPLAPIAKPVGYLMDVESGKADPANALDFARGLVTGRSGQH
jgi:hypothetical protein